MKKESVFANKATVGEKYLSKTGWPVQVIAVGEKGTEVKNLSSGIKSTVDGGTVLKPFSEAGISKDAREAKRAYKDGGRPSRNGKPRKARLEKSLARVGDRRVIKRTYKQKELIMTVNAEGFHVDGKTYTSLTAAAQNFSGKNMTNGPKWWGFAK